MPTNVPKSHNQMKHQMPSFGQRTQLGTTCTEDKEEIILSTLKECIVGFCERYRGENKILLYKAIIKLIWTYGVEQCACSCKSYVNIIQNFQSKTLRMLANVPWYASSLTLHTDLEIPTDQDQCTNRSDSQDHPNNLASILQHDSQYRILQKMK